MRSKHKKIFKELFLEKNINKFNEYSYNNTITIEESSENFFKIKIKSFRNHLIFKDRDDSTEYKILKFANGGAFFISILFFICIIIFSILNLTIFTWISSIIGLPIIIITLFNVLINLKIIKKYYKIKRGIEENEKDKKDRKVIRTLEKIVDKKTARRIKLKSLK